MNKRLHQILLNEGEASSGEAKGVVYKVLGKEYTQTELDAYMNKIEADRLTAEKEKIAALLERDTIKSRVKSVFSSEDEKRLDSAREILRELGHSEEEIEEWVKANGPATEDEVIEEPKAGRKGTVANEGTNELNVAISALKETQQNMLSEMLATWAEQSQTAVLDTHKGVTTLLEAATRLRGKDKAGEIREKIKENLRKQGVEEVYRRMQVSGVKPSAKLFSEAFTKAADSLADSYSGVIGDPSLLGRSSETAARMKDPFAGRKPAPEPKYSPNMSRADVDEQVENWLKDELLKMAAEAPEGVTSGSKA